ncbi:MAG TPA: hypothetical protein VMV60_10360 [Thermoanaerobaculia bacterium]|nr:hypothetical protein [Thermoanaerobaculia bacterium]
MTDGRVDLEGRVALLESALRDVSARLAALEAGRVGAAGTAEAASLTATVASRAPVAPLASAATLPAPTHQDLEAAEEGAPVANALTLAGRSFLVLGGAFLLRAITEGGRVPAFTGALLGLAYALLWIGASWRAGTRGARASASVHGVTAAIIAFPLVGEAATRLAAFSPTAAAIALAAVTAAFCASGVLTRLPLLVWIGVLAGAGTASGLFVATGAIATFVVFLFALYAATLVLRRGPGAARIEWVPAAAAASTLAIGAWLSTRAGGTPENWTAVGPFGIAALAAALILLAFAGAIHDARSRSLMPTATDVLQPAGALTVAVGILWGGPAIAVFWGLLGIVLSARSPRDGRGWIAWLAAGVVFGSALLSGLFRDEVLAFVVAPDGFPSASGPAVFAGIAALVAFVVAAAGAPSAPILRGGPPLVSAAVALGGILAFAVGLAPFTSTPSGLALVRTAVLCAAALAAAFTARWPRLATLALLALPLLAAAGLKLLFEDLRNGQPAALFAAFALYGITLLLVSRLVRRRKRREERIS